MKFELNYSESDETAHVFKFHNFITVKLFLNNLHRQNHFNLQINSCKFIVIYYFLRNYPFYQ